MFISKSFDIICDVEDLLTGKKKTPNVPPNAHQTSQVEGECFKFLLTLDWRKATPSPHQKMELLMENSSKSYRLVCSLLILRRSVPSIYLSNDPTALMLKY